MLEKRKILFIAANPSNLAEVDSEKEYKIVDKIFRGKGFEDRFDVKFVPKATPEDIVEYVRGQIWLIHFCGHGKPHKIILENELGTSLPVRAGSLLQYIDEVHGLKCVLLNACNSNVLAEQIQDIVDYSIGFDGPIENEDAIQFVKSFYESFARVESVPMAFRAVHKKLALENNNKYTVVFKCRNSVIMNAIKTEIVPKLNRSLIQREDLEREVNEIRRDITRLKRKVQQGEVNVNTLFWDLIDGCPTSVSGIIWFEENKSALSGELVNMVAPHKSPEEKQFLKEDLDVMFIALSISLVAVDEQYNKSNFHAHMTFDKKYYEEALDRLPDQVPTHYREDFLPYFRDNVRHIKNLL